MTTSKEKLLAYAREMELGNPQFLTLDILINSHRKLREAYKVDQQEWQKKLEEGYEHGKKLGFASSNVKIEDISAMSILDFCNLIVNEQGEG